MARLTGHDRLRAGIRVSTAVFTVVRAVLIQPLPYREANRLVIFRADAPGFTNYPGITGNEFHALRERSEVFEDVAAINGVNASLTDGDEMKRVAGGSATDNVLSLLGVQPAFGRALASRLDFGRDYGRSVVVSCDLWQRRWLATGRWLDATSPSTTSTSRSSASRPKDFGP